MPQEKNKKIHLIYGCIAAVLIIALGVALILSCLDIYNSGAHPYSPESIGLRFQRIAILVYVCITIIVGGIVLGLALPLDGRKPKASRDALVAMKKMKAKASSLDAESAAAVKKEETLRLVLRIGTAVLFVALMIYPILYFKDTSHFTILSVNDDIRKAVCTALIPTVVGLLLCFGCTLLEGKSIERETGIYKKAIAAAKGIAAPTTSVGVKKKNTVIAVRCVIAAVAVCFIILGVMNGGMKDVLNKAVAICTECIGLG